MSKSTLKKLELPIAITMIVVFVFILVIVFLFPTADVDAIGNAFATGDWSEVNPLFDFFGLFRGGTALGDLQADIAKWFTPATFGEMDTDNAAFTVTFYLQGIITWFVVMAIIIALVYWMRRSGAPAAA